MSNQFHKILDHVRFEAKEIGNVQASINGHVWGMLDAIINHPLDCGVKRWKSLSFSYTSPKRATDNDVPRRILLVIRAITEGGEDVVCFCEGDNYQAALLTFCYDTETGGPVWKPDTPRDQRRPVKDFFDTIETKSEEPRPVRRKSST